MVQEYFGILVEGIVGELRPVALNMMDVKNAGENRRKDSPERPIPICCQENRDIVGALINLVQVAVPGACFIMENRNYNNERQD